MVEATMGLRVMLTSMFLLIATLACFATGAANDSRSRNGYYITTFDQGDYQEHLKRYPSGELYQWQLKYKGKKVRLMRFWQNSRLMLERSYQQGRRHGSSHSWHANGRLASLQHHQNGLEVGWQKQWDTTGDLFVNYFAKNGRSYGLVNARACQPKGN